ncbi:MAG: hypothetical protein MR266_04345 [Erysipelotrichaceae bacterium]|nr:hypothetical protein [Erysipelotrichaceae bacterium]
MLELKTMKEHQRNSNVFVYLAYDLIFQNLGNSKYLNLVTYFISCLTYIDYKDLIGKIIISSSKSDKRIIDTKMIKDLLYLVDTPNKFKISIEMNRVSSLNKNIIDRNIAYLVDAYTTNIQTKNNYKDLIPAIQFNLNLCDVKKQDKYRNAYLIQDINKNILTDKLKIYHINILKLYKMWYDKSIKKDDFKFKKLCFMGTLLLENEWTKFYELLDNAPSDFDDELKNEVKELITFMNNNDILIARYYDRDELREFYVDGFREEGEKKGEKKGVFRVALNMLKNKFKINDIVVATGLSKEEILKLKEEK